MAKKRVTTVEEMELPPERVPAEPEPEPEIAPELSRLDAMFDELQGDDVYILVNRQPGHGTAKMQFLYRLNATDYPDAGAVQEKIQRDYGGGDYRLLFRDSEQMLKNIAISIAPLPAAQTATTAQAPDAMVRILETMNNGFQMLAAKLAERPAIDPMAQMGSMLDMLAKMRTTVDPPQSGKSREVNPIQIVRDTLELKRELEDEVPHRGGSNFSDIIFELVRGFAKNVNFGEVLQGLQRAAGAAVQQPPAQPAPAPAIQQQAGGMTIPPAFQTMIFAAQNGLKAESMVDLMLEQLPADNATAAALLKSEAPALLDQIAASRPDLSNLRAWFETLRLACIDDLTDDELPPENTGEPAS